MSEIDLTDPTAILLAVAEALRRGGVASAAYGGLALAAYGEARETKDADLTVAGGVAGADAAAMLERAGLPARLGFDRRALGGNLVTRLTLIGGAPSHPVNTADLVEPRSARYARLVLDRALAGTLRDRSLRVIAPEDFVILKVLSTRDRDLEDAASVVRHLGERLDVAAIRDEVGRLATEISSHDAAGRLDRMLRMVES